MGMAPLRPGTEAGKQGILEGWRRFEYEAPEAVRALVSHVILNDSLPCRRLRFSRGFQIQW